MKKLFLMAVAVCLITACEKPITGIDDDYFDDEEVVDSDSDPMKKFTFTVKGDFDSSGMRGYLSADGKDMKDLWVFDYVDNKLVQQKHLTSTDDEWGAPTMNLIYGTHHVYFVVSRGNTPTLDTATKTITWEKPSDTFWKDYEVEVVYTSNGNRAVTLDRVVTRFRATIKDSIPEGVASITISPALWNLGLNYTTGAPTTASTTFTGVITLPSSYIGQTNTLLNLYGFSGKMEWTTNITITAKKSNNDVAGTVTLEDVPFKANRSTHYTGHLFAVASSMGLTLNDTWDDSETGIW